MWEVKKKLGSKKTEPPAAKKNENGELVTNSSELKQLYERTYKKRLEHRKIKPELENMYKLKMNLLIIDNWTKENLSIVLKSLKRSKSADSHGLIYELFRPEVIGSDLFSSLLMLCNNMKSQMSVPEFVTYPNITSIYKSRHI